MKYYVGCYCGLYIVCKDYLFNCYFFKLWYIFEGIELLIGYEVIFWGFFFFIDVKVDFWYYKVNILGKEE